MKSVFLIGPMGAGKTTIGRHLATELSLPFVDTDQEIEDRSGADIPWIFDVEGEEGFRVREQRVLADVCASTLAVVATGGGIVMLAENREMIKKSGFVVYLHATVKQQLSRTGKDRNRPLLNDGEPEQVLSQLMEVREPLYREIAQIVIPTDNRNPRVTAGEIARQVRELAKPL